MSKNFRHKVKIRSYSLTNIYGKMARRINVDDADENEEGENVYTVEDEYNDARLCRICVENDPVKRARFSTYPD